ncbi:MAG: MBL fold metallo-hydrolase [Bacillota bacterium]|nr:MBL fold metallo-hydrolase [Bacillota bacterium]
MKKDSILTVLGCRGSMAVSSEATAKYGGSTSAFWLKAKGKHILFDAGTGILKAELPHAEAHLLLSHVHIDHILGIPFWTPLFSENNRIHIYSEPRCGMSIREQLANFLRPPYWPVGIDLFCGVREYHDISAGESFSLGDGVIVRTLRANHPDTCTAFRVEWENHAVVYALDYEHSADADKALIAFAKNCDVLIYDNTYTPTEYEKKIGWGHSTWEEGLRIKKAAAVKTLLLSHHATDHTDALLDDLQQKLTERNDQVFLAREGMEILL